MHFIFSCTQKIYFFLLYSNEWCDGIYWVDDKYLRIELILSKWAIKYILNIPRYFSDFPIQWFSQEVNAKRIKVWVKNWACDWS